MTRRSGQNGTVVRHGNKWRGRFLVDVEGQAKRKLCNVLLGDCDTMTKPEAKRKLREYIEGLGINEMHYQIPGDAPALTFELAADRYIATALTLLKPSSRSTRESHIKVLKARLGQRGVDTITDETVAELIVEWNGEGLSRAIPATVPATVREMRFAGSCT
jgi:hypothetical protein